ncbi:MAG: hypothetical protein ACFFB3_07555 [Candidatus Hodarchaeota archaeon]
MNRKIFLIACSILAILILNMSNAFQNSSHGRANETVLQDLGQFDSNREIFTREKYNIIEIQGSSDAPQADNLEIIYPNGGEILRGNITIRWIYGFDFIEAPDALYSVFYSPDNGAHWIQIAYYIIGTEFQWDTTLYETRGTDFLIKVVVHSKILGTEEDISDGTFVIDNTKSGVDFLPFAFFGLLALFAVLSTIGLGYILINKRFKKIETLMEIPHATGAEFIKSLRHKVIIGLDNIRDEFLLEAGDIPSIERVPDECTMADFFPSDIQEDLRMEMKGRTVLTLIEIAYQEPNETNPARLARSLNIPPSTLSKEIKKLISLDYIDIHVSDQVLSDGRYRNFTITTKGFVFLSILNDALKVTINRAKGKPMAESAYWSP